MSVLRTFKDCLTDRRFLAYLVVGTLSFSALFIYLSTVSFFLSDVFDIPTAYFGLAFAISVVGFVIRQPRECSARHHLGQDQTLLFGATLCVVVSLLALTVADNAGSLPFYSLLSPPLSSSALDLFQPTHPWVQSRYSLTRQVLPLRFTARFTPYRQPPWVL